MGGEKGEWYDVSGGFFGVRVRGGRGFGFGFVCVGENVCVGECVGGRECVWESGSCGIG